METKTKKEDKFIHDSFSLFTDFDIHLFRSGKHYKLYEKLGAHVVRNKDVEGTYFAVWAPNAKSISVIGYFNQWQRGKHVLYPRWDGSGIWEGFFADVQHGEAYKYAIESSAGDVVDKADPFAFYTEMPPKTASIVWSAKYEWKDDEWLKQRKSLVGKARPYSVYEVHFGSWRRKNGNEYMSYPDMARDLVDYVKEMGFTHVEFLPVMEHPFHGSWGYQVTGYFAPTSRYGSPEDFMYLVDCFHKEGIGVILDWVPSHFPGDAHGLFKFDGTFLFEHADPRKGFHPDWKSYIFNYGRSEVRSFLISNALFWLERFHIDGLRVDAVASMLYLDYSRKAGEWVPNQYGGNENLEAIDFLKYFNHMVHTECPGVITVAEESTAWPLVTRPPYLGGLGFSFKWNMGWMHDTLNYFKRDPVFRRFHQNDLTFAMLYHHHENFILPLSHDEVVHGKGSLLGRMPGDDWQNFANLRTLLGYQWLFPGKKLLFMGGEFGQRAEWNANTGLHWHLLDMGPFHVGLQRFMEDLNKLYRAEAGLWETDYDMDGFFWVDCSDHENSVLSFMRQNRDRSSRLLVIMNLTPVQRYGYRIG